MSLLSDLDEVGPTEPLVSLEAGYSEPEIERDSPAQCFWLIVGAALFCWLVIGMIMVWVLR